MPHIRKNTTLSLSLTAVLFGSLAITACSQQPAEQSSQSNEAPVEKTDEHAHDDHEAEHKHDEDEYKQEEHEHDHKDGEGMMHHGKHVHGEAELTAVVDGEKMVIELNSPSMNVFGFEHEPSTDEQKATVETQEALLKDASKVITVDGGDCTATDVDVDMPFAEHAEHDHEHKDEHEHEEHKDDQAKEHAEGETHSDVKATYTYSCKDSAGIKGFETNAFSTFSGFTKINLNWVNGDKQGAKALTKDDYNVMFSE